MSITVETYKAIELWFEFLSHFLGFHLTLPRTLHGSCKVRSAIIATQETILFKGDFLVGTEIIVDNDVLKQMCHVSCPGSD